MSAFVNKLNQVIFQLDNNNRSVAFRMLIDCILDTENISNFDEAIALTAWHDEHPNENDAFDERVRNLLAKLKNQNIQFKDDNDLLVKATGLSKKYGKNNFELGPLDIEVKSGQLVGLVGENGNGKTTLLRMLACDLSYSAGDIQFLFDANDKELYSLRTRLTYIPQRTPKWHGKVKDNLKLTATHYGILPAENEAWVLMLMIRFGLWKFRNHSWNELSSGYKMRFELARTFLRKPKLLLLDEPLANLDILSQQLILEDLKLLGKSLSNPLGIILSSQQLYEVEKVSDEVIFLKNGKASSFNALKDDNNNNGNVLIVELEIGNQKDELLAALNGLEIVELKLLGSNYYIEIKDVEQDVLLQNIINAKIDLKYFRNISNSTRRFFNQ